MFDCLQTNNAGHLEHSTHKLMQVRQGMVLHQFICLNLSGKKKTGQVTDIIRSPFLVQLMSQINNLSHMNEKTIMPSGCLPSPWSRQAGSSWQYQFFLKTLLK